MFVLLLIIEDFFLLIWLIDSSINGFSPNVFDECFQKLAVKSALVRQGSGGEKNPEKVMVYLRIRPFTEAERDMGEEQVRL